MARYRENRAAGQANHRALANAMGSSGAAVVFPGGTVVVVMAALAITGLGVLTSIGLSTALVVALRPPGLGSPVALPARRDRPSARARDPDAVDPDGLPGRG